MNQNEYLNTDNQDADQGKHYICHNVYAEDAVDIMAELEADPKVQRFIKLLDEAKSFRKAHNYGPYTSECEYLAARVYCGKDQIYDTMLKMYNVGYLKGYQAAQRKERAKNRREKKA